MQPTMSILALYNYDNTLFDTMRVPNNYVDKDTLVTELLGNLYECEVIYTDAEIMKSMIGNWSRTMISEWEQLGENLEAKYTAYGLTEKNEELRDLRASGNGSSSGVNSTNVAGFNNLNDDNSLVPSDKTNTSLTSSTRSTDTGTVDRNRTISGVVNGKSSAQLLLEEIKLRTSYDIYSIIIDDFKQRFCLMIY